MTAGLVLGEINDKADEFETERRFQEFKWAQTQDLDGAMRAVKPGEAGGFAETWTGNYSTRAKEFFASVPDHLKPKYDARLFDTEREMYGSAATFARGEQKRFSVQSLEDHKNRVAASGDIDKSKRDYEELLNANPFLTEIEKDEIRRKHLSDIEENYVQNRISQGADIDEIIKELEKAPPAAKQRPAPLGAEHAASQSGLDFIKGHEGYTPTSKWDYKQYSVGYGTKGMPGESISKEEAERRLIEETVTVGSWLDKNVTVPLTENERDALISFGFNLGTDDLELLLPDINAGRKDVVARRMRSFNRAGGEVLSGLVRRRNEEAALFLRPGPVREKRVQVAEAGTPGTATDAPPAGAAPPSGEPVSGEAGVGVSADGTAKLPSAEEVSRFQYLTGDRRVQLLGAARRAKETSLQSKLWDFKQQIEDDVRSRRETGVGRTGMDLETIQKTVEPSVWNRYQLDARKADLEYEATRELKTMPTERMTTYLPTLVPKEGEADYDIKADVYTKAKKIADDIREAREKDPAASVADFPEVKAAAEKFAAAQKEGGADIGELLKIRLDAQERAGIPESDRSPITKAEAQALLDLPSNPYLLTEKEYRKRLQSAADRAEEQYGPLAARQVFEAAVRFHVKDKTGSEAAAGMLTKMARGEPVTRDDYRRMTALQDIDTVSRSFDATLSPWLDEEGDRPAISPLYGKDSLEFATNYAAEQANVKPNAKQEQWIRDNPDQWSVYDAKFGRGAAARALSATPSKGKEPPRQPPK